MPRPRVILLRAPGTNCDEETAFAWEKAGAKVEPVHVNRLIESPGRLAEFQILTIPGGFSYGDDLGAGRILATHLELALGAELTRFHDRGGFILGICNGFQVLVRAGLLPGGIRDRPATLAHNESGRFEARWVKLAPTPGLSPFVRFDEPIELPVAHGEGRFLTSMADDLDRLTTTGQVVLHYCDQQGRPTESYPANPNGSPGGAAALCDPTGRIMGLMPHPERYVEPWHHPRWSRSKARPKQGDGMRIFTAATTAWQ